MLLAGTFQEIVPLSVEALRQLDADGQLLYTLERLEAAGFRLPRGLDLEGARRVFEVIKATQEARWRYRPGPFHGKVTVFRASEQPREAPDDPTLGWGTHTADVEVHTVPGYHQNLILPPQVETLGRTLAAALTAAGREDDPND